MNTWDAWKKAHEEFLRRNLQFERLGIFNLFENSAGNAGLAIAGYKELEKQVQVNRQPFTDASNKLLEVLKMNQDSTAETERVSAKDVSQVGFWAFVAIMIGPGTALLFGIFFSNTIAKPLGAKIAGVVDIAQKISAGDLTNQISLAHQQDEVGQLQNAFYTMNKDLNALVNRIQKSSNQISSSADQITASGRNLEATVTEQVASTNEVSATAHEIAATSRQLVKTMEQVSAMAEQTTVAAGNSKDNLNHIDAVMRQLLEATQLTLLGLKTRGFLDQSVDLLVDAATNE